MKICLDKVLLLFIIIQFLVLPIFKFYELNFGFPKLNFAIIRGIFFFVTFFCLLLVPSSEKTRKLKSNSYYLFYIFYFLCVLIILINLDLYFLDSIHSKAYLNRIDSVIILYPLMFLSGHYSNNSWDKYINISFLIFSFFLVLNAQVFIDSYVNFIVENPINYIKVSDSYLFICLLNFKRIKSNKYFYILSIICLLLVPARSNVALFFMFSFIFMDFYKNWKVLIFFTSLICIVILFLLYNESYLDLVLKSRFTLDLENDASFIARIGTVLDNFNMNFIEYFTGNYMGDITRFKEEGLEAHSHISILNNFGLVPFILFLIMLVISFKKSNQNKPDIKVMVWIFNISVMFFKSFLYPFFFFNLSYSNNNKYE
jgi:hypothetical protein